MSKSVLREEVRRGQPRRPARGPGRTRSVPGFLLGLCVGTTLSLVFGVVVFLVTRPEATPQTAPPAATQTAGDQGGAGQPQAAVDVTVRHLGDLKVQIEAQISAPGSYDPITKGQVAAYTDMVAMPMAHRQGPIVMSEAAGRPGVYQALTTVAMVGEYDVTVELRQPMAAKAHKRLKIETVK